MDTPFPRLRVMEIARDDSRVAIEGTVSVTRVGRETWVGDRHVGYLKRGDFLAPGRWHDGGDRWSFVLDRPADVSELEGASELEVLDGWWGASAELVLDQSLIWNTCQWTEAADHDHCAICWATISTHENGKHFAAERGGRVCAPCYRRFVGKRSLGFIPDAAGQGDAEDRPSAGSRSPSRCD